MLLILTRLDRANRQPSGRRLDQLKAGCGCGRLGLSDMDDVAEESRGVMELRVYPRLSDDSLIGVVLIHNPDAA